LSEVSAQFLAAKSYQSDKKRCFNEPRTQLLQRRQYLDDLAEKLRIYLLHRQTEEKHQLVNLTQRLMTHSPRYQLQMIETRHQRLAEKLRGSLDHLILNQRSAFQSLVKQLNTLSPLSTLERGYAICWKLPERSIVTSAAQVVWMIKSALRLAREKYFVGWRELNEQKELSLKPL